MPWRWGFLTSNSTMFSSEDDILSVKIIRDFYCDAFQMDELTRQA
jgi:hypothetical protein